ncbi:hypothetical protein INT43_000674 [Umbelopsis isabellina]|uniref:SAP domain-containing protein n=1 Tax=Mortierella isabellina TaxID=91625 RepID=A0A8H7UGC7_MORIS|nr:hypothetical protein INT43_000674 [Umbelopsis isabellina]
MALPEDLTKLRVVDLRDELTKRNLPTKGKKNELIERLQEALQQEPEAAQDNASEEVTAKDDDKPVNTNGESKSKVGQENNATAPTKLTDSQAILDIPAEMDNSMHVQGEAEKEIEQRQEPVVTKNSGLADSTIDQSMEVEEERGLKRKNTDVVDSEGKKPKIEPEVPATAPEGPAEPVTSQASDAQQPPPPATSEGPTEESKGQETAASDVVATTNAMYIKGFVRPLILRHVEELIKKYGQVKKFWMDSIKTHCYVIYENSDEASAAHKNIDNIVFPPDTGRTLHVGSITESKAEEMIVLEQEAAEKRIKFDWELAIKELPSTIPSRPLEDAAPAEPSTSPTTKRSKLGGIEQVAKQLSKAAAESGRVTSEVITPPTEGLASSSLRARTVKVLSLDELFKKTKAHPALYYQSVPEEMAQKRLETMRGSHE